jgi:hypothetical protein
MSCKKTDVINIIEINKANIEYLNKITAMKNFTNYINDIYVWKDNITTLMFGISISLLIYSPKLCFACALIIFYLKHSYILNIIL